MSSNRTNEVGLLGAVLRDPSKYDAAKDLVSALDFDWHCYAWCWEAFEKLHNDGMVIDVIVLGDELERMGKLAELQLDDTKQFTGRAALSKIRSDGNPRAVESYIRNILDYSAKRELERLAPMMSSWAQNGRKAHDIIADIERRLAAIRTFDSKAAKHTMSMAEAVSSAYDYTDKAAKGEVKTVKTGFVDLDNTLKGLYGGDLYCIAARPGKGKTAWLGSLVKNVALQGKRVAVFELEMTNQAIAMRLLAQQSGVSVDKQRSGELLEADWLKYTNAVEALSEWKVFINDLPSISPARIRQELRRIGDVDLIVIDYIQLATADVKTEKRYLEVSEIAKALKTLAKEFDTPIVTAAQLSRATETRSDKKPILSDLKESGGIEENSDVIMFLHCPDEVKPNEIDLIIAKHRNGRIGNIPMLYQPELTRFESLAKGRL
jgi:replicative DNA helicase